MPLATKTSGRRQASLLLSDGHRFDGELIGAPVAASGELVFTTGMVGYSEALTDPSYFGQILVFTYPLIGNYGIPALPNSLQWPIARGFESDRVHAAAAIVTLDTAEAFHWNSFHSLDSWLAQQGVAGIVGLDTRHLVHLVRQNKGLLGRVEPENPTGIRANCAQISESAAAGFFDPGEHCVMPQVSVKEPVRIAKPDGGKTGKRIGLVDCGVKWNIIRQLVELGCEVELIPWDYDLSRVDCSGFLLSNGPGDPTKTGPLRQRVSELLTGTRPILGICLGHQILALAAGARTVRLAYGHRSHNQPVYLVGTRRGFITSQNHGYVVDETSLPDDWQVWFRNANDQTIEGIAHRSRPFRSVQFHPEAAGGPRDTSFILEDFVAAIAK